MENEKALLLLNRLLNCYGLEELSDKLSINDIWKLSGRLEWLSESEKALLLRYLLDKSIDPGFVTKDYDGKETCREVFYSLQKFNQIKSLSESNRCKDTFLLILATVYQLCRPNDHSYLHLVNNLPEIIMDGLTPMEMLDRAQHIANYLKDLHTFYSCDQFMRDIIADLDEPTKT